MDAADRVPGTFRDPEGRWWKVRLTVGTVADVKRETGMNLTLVSKDASWVDVIFGDPEKLVAMLWVPCADQAKERGVAPEQFGHLFDGPTLEAAGVALAEAVAAFFPRSRIGDALKAGVTKILETMDETGVRRIEAAVSTACASLTSAPESSAATPAG